jgi:hypothetical protein
VATRLAHKPERSVPEDLLQPDDPDNAWALAAAGNGRVAAVVTFNRCDVIGARPDSV